MKKLLYCAAALAAVLSAGSCQRENLEPVVKGGVTYTITLPETVQTKGEGGYAKYDLYYEVYKTLDPTNAQLLFENPQGNPVVMEGNTHELTLDLLNDQDYTILFWANKNEAKDANDNAYFNVADLRNVVVNSSVSNNDDRDAFCGMDQITQHDGAVAKTVTLKRPFAQLNIATLISTEDYDITPVSSLVSVSDVPTAYNVYAAAPTGEEHSVTYTNNTVPADNLTGEYKWVAMNYVLVPEGNIDVYYEITTNSGVVKNTVNNVPVKANYRTNIIGNLLTSNAKYTVDLQPGFADTDANGNMDDSGNMEVITAGLVKNINGDYEITTPNGLVYAMTNLWAQEGGNYYITKTIDMTGVSVTPPSIPSGITLSVKTAVPVVTRAAGEPIVIIGLDFLLDTVSSGANVSIEGVTLQNDENTDPVLVNKVEDGANVVLSNCEVGNSTETSGAMEDLVGEGAENVVDATDISGLQALQAALQSSVEEITVSQSINIPAGDPVVLNLNNKKIVAVDANESGNYGLINVSAGATLTVNGPGSITLTALHNREWNAYSSVISNQRGTLEVNEGVVIEHLGGTAMAYGIDNLTNGKGTKATTTVNGATVKSVYRAIRQFLNGTEAANELYVKAGSKVLGDNKAIWPHDANSSANSGKLVVEAGAEINDVYLTAASADKEWPLEISVASSAFVEGGEIVLGTIPEGYEVLESNGVWSVVRSYVYDEAADTYTIYTAKGLRWVADVVNATTPYTPTLFDNATVKLANDIDLQNEEWIPIGDDRSQRTEFHGTFDGQGYTVRNVMITKKTDRDDANKSSYGLFGNLKGTVKNLTVENVSISGAPKFIGALVGRMNNGLVENCHVRNSSVSCENWTIGGLVGQLNDGKIARCTVENTTVTGYAAVGAIAGIALNEGERTIENCVVKDCEIIQNGNFGGDYDKMFGAVLGATYSGELIVYINGCSVENTTVLGEESDTICGFVSEGDQLFIDSNVSVVADADALVEALEAGKDVKFSGDIKIDPANMSNAYGKTGINVKNGQTIDGNNHILDIKGAGGTWDSGINTTGGLIRNITVTGSFRGIFVNHTGTHSETVILENVVVDGTTYTISCDQGMNQNLEAYNSTFNGWTSYAATIGTVLFDDCSFGYGNGYAFCRPYAPTTFKDCEFEEGFKIDPRAAVTFENCTFGGVAVTVENVATLVTGTDKVTVK